MTPGEQRQNIREAARDFAIVLVAFAALFGALVAFTGSAA